MSIKTIISKSIILMLILSIFSLSLVSAYDDSDSDYGDGGYDNSDTNYGNGDYDDSDTDYGNGGADDSPPPVTPPPVTPPPTSPDIIGGVNDGADAGAGAEPPAEPPVVVITNTAPTLSIPDQNINEDAGFLDNLIDLWNYVVDDFTSAANMVFSIVAQTNANIISCSLDSNRFIDCATQPNQNGFSDITVSATDEGGLTGFGTFRINVNAVNDGPSVDILEPGSKVTEEVEFDFAAAASDADGDALTFTLDFGDGTSIATGNVVNGEIEATHTYAEEGTYTITVTVSDGSLTGTDSKTVKAEESPTSDLKAIIYIGGIAFDNEFPRAGDELRVFVNFENQGEDDLRDARLTAIIQDLGIRSRTISTDVKDGREALNTLTLEIPENANAGRYWVEIVIDIDGDRRIKYRPIDII